MKKRKTARPTTRGLGVALRLVAAVAATVRARGGKYLRGLTTGDPRTLALYGRVAVAFEGANCILGGAAFRTVAALAGKPARAILRGLPDKQMNWKPRGKRVPNEAGHRSADIQRG